MTLTTQDFWKTVIAGLLATFVMTLTGFWQSGVGLTALDGGAMLTQNLTSAHPDLPYSLAYGNLAHFANGVMLAPIWVVFLKSHLPGNWIVGGITYGILTTLAALVVIVPLVAGAGLFFTNTPAPAWMSLGSLVFHLAYGLTLTLSLEVAGVKNV